MILITTEVTDATTKGTSSRCGRSHPWRRPRDRLEQAGVEAHTAGGDGVIVINGPEPGTVVSLAEGTTILGRGENCEVQVEDVSVSREHCSVELTAEYCRIRDMDSSNGVRVNGMPRTEHYLQHGDTVEMGEIRFKFHAS